MTRDARKAVSKSYWDQANERIVEQFLDWDRLRRAERELKLLKKELRAFASALELWPRSAHDYPTVRYIVQRMRQEMRKAARQSSSRPQAKKEK